jgi:HEAT repeat protein
MKALLDALPAAAADDLRCLALVLGWLEGVAVERALTRLLGQPTARREVIEALARHGARVNDLLTEQLDAPEVETRQAAIIALGRIGDAGAVPALVRMLTESPELVIVTAGALAKIGDRRAFAALLGLMGHEDASVRQAIVSALNSLGHPDMAAEMVGRLRDTDARVRESAVKIAGYFGYAECVELLLAACADPDLNVRRIALEHIPYLDDPRGFAILRDALRQPQAAARAAAARGLAQVEGTAALQPLLAALEDRDPWVRYYAARSLGRHAFPDALAALARLAQGDPANHVRAAASEALGHIGGARVVSILAPLAESEDRDLARAALSALGLVSHPDALPPLLSALRAPQPTRQLDALRALAERGGVGAAGALQWVAAADANPTVAQAAIEALARLATPESLAALVALTADEPRREACIAALAQAGEAHADQIARGLAHAQPAVRCATVEALARMKRPYASELLATALDDPEAVVRLAAVQALDRLGSRRAERQLTVLARRDADLAVRRAAQVALQRKT